MTSVQIIPGDFTITDPAWPRLHLWRKGHVFTSDDFSVDGDPVGRMTTAALGGQPVAWEGNSGAWSAADGVLNSPTGTGSMFLNLPGNDVEMSATLEKLPTTSQMLIVLRRTAIDFSPSVEQVRVQIFTDGTVVLQHQVSGETTKIDTASVKASPGDIITARAEGEDVQVLLNGDVIASGTTPVLSGRYFGFSVTNVGTAASIDDLLVKAI